MGEWKFRPLHFRKSCGRILIQVNKDMTGAGGRRYPPGPVKREAGARPARSRRCERRVMLHAAFWQRMSLGRKFISCEERKGAAKAPDNGERNRIPGKAKLAETLKSEDLPVMCAMRPRGIGWR